MEFYKLMPKIELHLHLEGAIPYDALLELIQKYGGHKEIKSAKDIAKKFIFKNFDHFIELWVWKNQFLLEYEDFKFIAKNVALDLKNQNVKYAEIFISPADYRRHGLSSQLIIKAAAEGFKEAHGIKISIIADMVRDKGPDEALRTLHEVEEVREHKVIGIGLGGSEHKYPPELFAKLYEKARGMNFKTTVHSGEVCGAESVEKAINILRPDRIGHCLGAAENADLLSRIAKANIAVELCPISNIKTGALTAEKTYPLHKFIEAGVKFSINTDDPKMFGNSLADEYYLIDKKLGFEKRAITDFVINSISCAWISDKEKTAMQKEFYEQCKTINPENKVGM